MGENILIFMGKGLHNDCQQIYFQNDLCLFLKSPFIINSKFDAQITKWIVRPSRYLNISTVHVTHRAQANTEDKRNYQK